MNKTQLKNKCKEILNTSPLNQPINKVDFDFLMKVFENHPEWDSKKGVGIESIFVLPTQFKNKCFHLRRLDGSSTDISYLHSINQYNEKHYIKKACREAIRPIIREYVQALDLQNLICAVTNKPIPNGELHIDHCDLTFDEVVEKWLSITKQDLSINETKDNNLLTYFNSSDTIQEFREFHNENTHLRPVLKEVNLSQLRKK